MMILFKFFLCCLVIIIQCGFTQDYIRYTEVKSYGKILQPNYQIKTERVYLGIYTNTCYFNGKNRVFVSGFSSSLKTPPFTYDNVDYVPSVELVKKYNKAYNAGLRVGDELLEYNGKEITNEKHLTLLISRTYIGTISRIKFRRNGFIYDITILPEIREIGHSFYTPVFVYKVDCSRILQIIQNS